MSRGTSWTLWLAFALLATLGGAAGQGLEPAEETPEDELGASGAMQTLFSAFNTQFKDSVKWSSAFKAAPQSACNSQGAGSLCSSQAGSNVDHYAQLMLATSPAAYSSLDHPVLAAVRDQYVCSTCVAHSVIQAAEAAVASVTGRDVRDTGLLSVQQLAFCCNVSSAPERSCGSSWSLKEALGQFVACSPQLLLGKCLPYEPEYTFNKPRDVVCFADQLCQDNSPVASNGIFSYTPLDAVWKVQRHIREYGAVISRFDVMDDLRPFFGNYANTKSVYSPSQGAKLEQPHALILVGYNNANNYWIARNSWGTEFADGGSFKVAFGALNVLSNKDTYGVVWKPTSPGLALQLPLSPAPQRPGCQAYEASDGDYLSRIAFRTGVPVEKLLADNLDTVKNLDAPLAGTRLFVCDGQLQALMALRAALDATGKALPDWTAANATGPGGLCSFSAITCDSDGSVVRVDLSGDAIAGGTLPPAATFAGLPKLRALWLGSSGIRGTLPPSWGALTQLEELGLSSNELTGPLPKEWQALKFLKSLDLGNNSVTGTLPPLVGWPKMTDLRLSYNRLTGPIPFGSMAAMKGLRVLYLAANSLNGTLEPRLAQFCPLLEQVALDTNRLKGPLPQEWSGMTRLQSLWLFTNELTGSLPPSWGGAFKALTTLDVSDSRLSGSVPASWGALGGSPSATIQLANNAKLVGCLPKGLVAAVLRSNGCDGTGLKCSACP